MTQFGMYSTDDAAQRCQPRRAVNGTSTTRTGTSPKRTAATTWTSERHQRRCRHLHVVHRPLQLLQFDNWTYQPSYVSSNTPWFFNGVRVQIFPSDKLKIEPWMINGWQSYGKFNNAPGLGGQIALAAQRFDLDYREQLLGHRHARESRSQTRPHRRQHPGEVSTTGPSDAVEGRVHSDLRCRLRIRRRRQLRGGTADARRNSFSDSWPTTVSGSQRTSSG